jgi:protein-tyrosine phosphatase
MPDDRFDTAADSSHQIEFLPTRYDDPSVVALLEAYLQELEDRDPELRTSMKATAIDSSIGANAFVDDFEAPNGLFLAVHLNGKVAGIGGVRCFLDTFGSADGSVRVGEIKRMFFSPEARGKGLSRALLTRLEDAAIAFGCDIAKLDTRSCLTEARALYVSHGYVETTRYNDNPFAQHFYEKPLRANYDALRRFALTQGLTNDELPSRDLGDDRRVPLLGAFNFRDSGGYATTTGRSVRRGLIFRSDQMSSLADRDLETIRALGISQVHDFRLESERERQPSRHGLGWDPTVSVLSTSDSQGIDVTVIDIVREALAGQRPLPEPSFWEDAYESVLNAGRPMFVKMLQSLASEGGVPGLYHCTGGKDRTGMATMLLHRLLGVSDADIVDDFLATNLYRTSIRLASLREGFVKVGINPIAAIPIVGVTRSGIVRALTILDETYGGVESYLRDGGMDPLTFAQLRSLLLE